MALKISNEQMKNVITQILFKTKADVNRNYNNLLRKIQGKVKVTEQDLENALEFMLQSYYTHENGDKCVFVINKDYSTNEYMCDDLTISIHLVHEMLMEKAPWYKALLK